MLTELELAYGDDLITSNGICVKHVRLKDLKKYSAGNIYAFTQMFCLEPQDICVDLWSQGIDFEKLSYFDVFFILYFSRKEEHDKMFKVFMDIDHCEGYDVEGQKMLICMDENNNPISYIDVDVYLELKSFFKAIIGFQNSKPRKWANEATKKRILDMEVESRDDEKEPETLAMHIGSLVWANTCGYTWDNVWELTFFQFNSGLKHLDKIKHSAVLLLGHYSGTIDIKKVPQKELDWKII